MEKLGHPDMTWIGGPMSSGKTLELIRLCEMHSIAGSTVLAMKHGNDDKRSIPTFTLKQSDGGIWSPAHPLHAVLNPLQSTLRSRRGLEYPCVQLKSLMEFLCNPLILEFVDVFAFEEMQFFDDSREAVKYLQDHGKTVITAGLDSNWKREPFNHYTDLIVWATHIIKLKAVCMKCGSFDAIYSRRLVDDEREVVVGTSNYEARCSKCFYL